MRDYNFFSIYIDDKNREKKRTTYAILIAVSLALVVGGITSINYLRIHRLEKDIKALDEYINMPKVVNDNKSIIQKKNIFKSMTEYEEIIDNLEASFDENYLSYIDTFNLISASIPTADMKLTKIDINRQRLMMQCKASTKVDIAHFQYKLRRQKMIKDVSVSVIKYNDNDNEYVAEVKCMFEDVISDEDN